MIGIINPAVNPPAAKPMVAAPTMILVLARMAVSDRAMIEVAKTPARHLRIKFGERVIDYLQ
jgi:hypothetical protein